MGRNQLSKKTSPFFFILLFDIFITSAYADIVLPPPQEASQHKTGHIIFGLGAGGSFSSDVGASQTFPILDPITDELYVYSPTKPLQSAYLYNGFLGAEWDLSSHWGIQTSFNYNQTSPFSVQGSFTQGADIQSTDTYTYNYGVDTKQLLFDGKIFYTFRKCFRPYVLVGLGSSFNKTYNYTTDVPPFLTFTRMYANKTNVSFSYAVGAGIDTSITSHLRIGFGYRFMDLGEANLGAANIDGTSVTGALSQAHLYANEVLTQITCVFS